MLLLLIALVQSQQLHEFTIRPFGTLKQVFVDKHSIYYDGEESNGEISRSTGEVIDRLDYQYCGFGRFVYINEVLMMYDKQYQHRILDDALKLEKIDGCIYDGNDLVVSSGDQIYKFGDKSNQKELKAIFLGIINERVAVLAQSEGLVCLYQYDDTLKDHYCLKLEGSNITFEQLNNQILLRDDKFAYILTSTSAEEIDYKLAKEAQFIDSKFYVHGKQVHVGHYFKSLQGGEYLLRLNSKNILLIRSFQRSLEIEIYDTESSKSVKLNYQVETNGKVLKAFLIDVQKVQILSTNQFKLLVQFDDLYTVLVDKSSILWKNEQSLIDINLVFFEQFQNEERTHKNSYYENLDQKSQLNPFILIENIILRLKNEVTDLFDGLQHQFRLWTQNLNQDQEIETIYGLRQKVFYLTKSHVLIGFDTYEKNKIFRQNFDLDKSYEFVASHLIESNLIQKEDGPQVQEVRLFFFYSKEKQRLGIFLFDDNSIFQISSQQQKSQFILNFPYRIEEGPGSKDNIVILIDENLDIVTYPKVSNLNSKEIIFYHHLDRTINGYKIIDGLIFKVWSLNFPDQIIMIRSSKSQDNPRVAIWDDRKVIFKLIDHSNFAVLTTDLDKLYLFIVNGLTGKIIFQAYQQEIDFEKNINLVYDEHQIFVSYYNKVNLIYEIWVVEIYHPKIEFSVFKMWEYYYNKADNQPNYYKEAEPFFLQQVYGFPYSIQKMRVSKTLRSLTKKNLLILTNKGQLYSQDRNMVSSRRRERVDQVILDYNLQSAELPPYQYILFVNSHFITHSIQYEGDNYYIEPTNLESTSLFVLYGLDVYLTRISPDKQYDMLQKDFSYITLIFTIVTITVASLYMKTKLSETKQLQQFYH